MSVNKPSIELLAEELIAARGAEYLRAQQILKRYISSISESELIAQIGKATNPDIFPKLLSVGISWAAQHAAQIRWKELEG